MRFTNIIQLFIVLTVGMYFVTQITNCSTNDELMLLQARRSLRTTEGPSRESIKVKGNAWKSTKQANSMPHTYDAINNEDAEIVYNIDYQGVKTHPSPTPTKHP
uniref:uncharacterized protein LOC122600955 n=1 Tax=Erigeron canadensis TaxID=72917 RepID=UPI001CB917C9|nr:uncharacterized protein LOC122600955 [Erigeron canadensis]